MMPSPETMHQCAPNVAPQTLAAIIQVESGGNDFALGVNGPIRNRPHPHNVAETAMLARYYIAKGYTVDLGLMQINSANLRGLGYTVEQILDPCNNLRAGSRILSHGYAGAAKRYGQGQEALRAALSAYNTGNYAQGFRNGYVAKYYGNKLKVTVHSPQNISLPAKPTVNIYTVDSTVFSIDSEKTHE